MFLTPDTLRQRIGRPRARRSTVIAWFRRELGVTPPLGLDGWPVIAEEVLVDLQRKRCGLGVESTPENRPSVRKVR